MANISTKEQGKVKGRGQNPNSRKNLEKGRWAKGRSGNPTGKSPGTLDRSTTLKKWAFVPIERVNPFTKKKEIVTVDDDVHLAWLRECRKGNITAIKEYLDTLHGKQTEKVEQDIKQKIVVEFIGDDAD